MKPCTDNNLNEAPATRQRHFLRIDFYERMTGEDVEGILTGNVHLLISGRDLLLCLLGSRFRLLPGTTERQSGTRGETPQPSPYIG